MLNDRTSFLGFLFLCCAVVVSHGCGSVGASTASTESEGYSSAQATERLNALASKMERFLPTLPVDSTMIPRAVEEDGSVHHVAPRDWTSGFFPGTLWQLNAAAPSPELEAAAETWTEFVRSQQYDDHTHDLGFKIYCSFGQGYELAGRMEYKDVIVSTASQLIERYSPVVKSIRSWDHNADKWDFPVIIDNMMNLELLFEAAKLSGDSTFYSIAAQHAATTYANHFRDDYSSYHVISYDTLTGEVAKRNTHQGFADDSAWARGQAWGLHGFTTAYRYTRNPDYLERAQQIADFFIHHPRLPADGVPYWDFNLPDTTAAPRDASAAAVAVSGLLELIEYSPSKADEYIAYVDKVLATFETPSYQATTAPFLLARSTGNHPKDSEIDSPINYGDYYYVEALRRRKNLRE